MPHIVIAGKLHPAGLKFLKNAKDISFDYIPDENPSVFLDYLPLAEGLVIRTQTLSSQNIANAPELKIVSRHGVGCDNIDVKALSSRGIPLVIVGDINSVTVAEHAMTLLLCASRRILKSNLAVTQGDWSYRDKFEPCEVYAKSLLIIGFGRIGQQLCRLAKAFGMHVIVYDPFLVSIDYDGVEKIDELKIGLKKADYVSLHVPKTEQFIIGAEELALLPKHAVIVNTSRGSNIDEVELVKALENDRLGAVALDVLAEEPPRKNNPLLSCRNAIITPHAAGLTIECAERMALQSVKNILDFFNGTLDPTLVVNGITR